MTDRGKRYCDLCWARILDHGYVDSCELCEHCLPDVVGDELSAGDEDLDVVLVERLIV